MRVYLVSFFLIIFGVVVSAQEVDWEFLKDDEGIRVFTRKTEGSPFKEIKVENMMKTDLSSLVSLMKDVDNHKNWTYANKTAEVLERHSEFSWIFYGYSDAPWPVQDRDMAIKASLSQDSVTKIVRNEGICIPDYIPEKDGVVRVPACRSLWTLEPVGADSIRVTLEIKIDMGGNLPAWLVNMVSSKGPYETVRNMEAEVQRPKYRDAELDYIID
jgi:hypothetical protein